MFSAYFKQTLITTVHEKRISTVESTRVKHSKGIIVYS